MSKKKERNRFWVNAETVASKDGGGWRTALVSVFDGDVQIGTYERNHAGWAEETFEPFQWNDRWFALYAPDYTATRVMSLPDCRDLGGEPAASDGFCPVEFYAPRYRERISKNLKTGQCFSSWGFAYFSFDSDETSEGYEATFGPWVTVPTGFIAGCIWGDDSSWKLECVDLELAARGQIVRTARFGHVQLARGHSLAESLEFDRHPPHWDLRMTLIRQERRDVATGALIDPYDE